MPAGLLLLQEQIGPGVDEERQIRRLSGHGIGIGIGPAVGRIMADLLTGRPPGHDLTRFRPSRFFDGSEIVPEPY